MKKKYIYVIYNMDRKELFFTKRYDIKPSEREQLQGENWTPVTFTFPHYVEYRRGLEDGFIDTIKKLMFTYFRDYKLIKPKFKKEK